MSYVLYAYFFPSYFNIVDFLYSMGIFARGRQCIHSVCGNATNSSLIQNASDLQKTTCES